MALLLLIKSSNWFTAFILLLNSTYMLAEYESAGCSDEGCGIPCYMRPVEDPCHYQQHSPCNDEGSTDLEQWVINLNSSLLRLENKLIQKGIIPAGDTCTPLHPIDHGGVIYSDLLLSPGVIAYYVCQDGYSIHGYPKRTCAPDGGWTNSENGDPVCEDSTVKCEPLINIPYGHVHYDITDTTIIQPGDVVTYSCDPPYLLEGAEYRICMSNGTWSEEEPRCAAPLTTTGNNTEGKANSKKSLILEVVTPIAVIVLLTVIAVFVVIIVVKVMKQKRKGYQGLDDNKNLVPSIDSGSRHKTSDEDHTEARNSQSETAVVTIRDTIS